MARRKALVVLTTAFPHGGTFEKNFLNPELPFLRKEFDEVEFIPAKVIGSVEDSFGSLKVDDGLARFLGFPARAAMFAHTVRGVGANKRHPDEYEQKSEIRSVAGGIANLAILGMAETAYRYLGREIESGRWNLDQTVFYSYWCKYPALALRWLKERYPNVCAVTRAHGSDLYAANAPYGVVSRQGAIVGGLDGVFTISEDGKRYLAQKYPAAVEKISVARLGTPEPGFRSRPSEDGTLRIASCSRIEPVKRVERIFETVLAMKRVFSGPIEWVHMGGGYGYRRLEKLVMRESAEGVGVRLLGNVSLGEVMELYKTRPCDVFLNTSRSEGVPVSIMEAMSCGIPCAGPSVGGVPEIVSPDSGGELFSPDATPGEIADVVLKIVESRKVWAERSERAFRYWESEFSAERNFERFSKQLAEL